MVVYSKHESKFVYAIGGYVGPNPRKRLTAWNAESAKTNRNPELREGLHCPFVPPLFFDKLQGVKENELNGFVGYSVIEKINHREFDNPLEFIITSMGYEYADEMLEMYNKSFSKRVDPCIYVTMSKNGCFYGHTLYLHTNDPDYFDFVGAYISTGLIKKIVKKYFLGDYTPVEGDTPVMPICRFIDMGYGYTNNNAIPNGGKVDETHNKKFNEDQRLDFKNDKEKDNPKKTNNDNSIYYNQSWDYESFSKSRQNTIDE